HAQRSRSYSLEARVEWRIGVVYQFKRHRREPLAGGRIGHIAHWIERSGRPAEALTIRFSRDLYPQVSIGPPTACIGPGPRAEAAVRGITPVLWIAGGMIGWRSPGSLAVPTSVHHEMHRRDGCSQIGAVPLVGATPGAEIVWIDGTDGRIILTGAPVVVA